MDFLNNAWLEILKMCNGNQTEATVVAVILMAIVLNLLLGD
jgi:hypothetical protein